MASMLDSYRKLLEKERDVVLKEQFTHFMTQIGITDSEETNSYFDSFQSMLSEIDHSESSLHEKLKGCIESDFFYQVLTAKTSNRERELRKITTLLSQFIQKSADNSTSDEQFLQNILADTLRTAADALETDRNSEQSVNEAWIDALRLGYDIFIGRKL